MCGFQFETSIDEDVAGYRETPDGNHALFGVEAHGADGVDEEYDHELDGMDKKDHELVTVEKVEDQGLVGVEDENNQELADVEDTRTALEVLRVEDWL